MMVFTIKLPSSFVHAPYPCSMIRNIISYTKVKRTTLCTNMVLLPFAPLVVLWFPWCVALLGSWDLLVCSAPVGASRCLPGSVALLVVLGWPCWSWFVVPPLFGFSFCSWLPSLPPRFVLFGALVHHLCFTHPPRTKAIVVCRRAQRTRCQGQKLVDDPTKRAIFHQQLPTTGIFIQHADWTQIKGAKKEDGGCVGQKSGNKYNDQTLCQQI